MHRDEVGSALFWGEEDRLAMRLTKWRFTEEEKYLICVPRRVSLL